MIKTETKAKQNITKQLKLDLKFFKSEVQTMEQLKADNKKIISELSNKIYELSSDDDLIKNDDFIKRTIKEQKHD